MKIEIVEKKEEEEKVVIYVHEKTSEIEMLAKKISNNFKTVEAFIDNERFFINYLDIESIYTQGGKVYLRAKNKVYMIKDRLYKIENELPKNSFIRISNSEIINFEMVLKLSTDIIGTLKIYFKSGNIAYSSRRYIKRIKDFLSK